MKSVAFVFSDDLDSEIKPLIIPFKSVNYIKQNTYDIIVNYSNSKEFTFKNQEDSAKEQLDNFRRWLIKENLK